MTNNHSLLLIALCASLLAGCAAKRPALYPNQTLQAQGQGSGEQAINECLALANTHGHSAASPAVKVAGGTAGGAAVGGAVGAAGGAFSGGAGSGAAFGAATGGALGLIGGLFRSGDPDPIQRRFVDQCLSEKGYQPIGWE